MGIPVIERIARDIFKAVGGVRQANDYAYDVNVERAKRRGNEPDHLKAVIYQGERTKLDQDLYNAAVWEQPFEVLLYIIPAEDDPVAPDTYINIVESDITKAVMADPQRAGIALDTKLLAPVPMSEIDGKFDCVVCRFNVHYRVDLADPYQLIG